MRGEREEVLTSAEVSVQSHVMAFAAEKSRLEEVFVDIEKYKKEIEQQIGISS